MNVRESITPRGEMLTDMETEFQWDNIDWKTVYEHVNRLQTRIAKAVKQHKWHLVKSRDKRSYHELPLRLPYPFGVILLKHASTVTLGCDRLQDNMEKFGSLTQIIC